MATVTELTMGRLEKNKGKKLVRSLGGKIYTLVAVEEKRQLIDIWDKGRDVREIHDMRGYLFFCQICERHKTFKNFSHFNYPHRITCENCIDLFTYDMEEIEEGAEIKAIMDEVEAQYKLGVTNDDKRVA